MKRKTLKLRKALQSLAQVEGTSAAAYVALHAAEVASGKFLPIAAHKKDIIAFVSLFEIDETDLEFVLAQFRLSGLKKKGDQDLALAQLVLDCLATTAQFEIPVQWIIEKRADLNGHGPVDTQEDMGS